MSLDIVILAAGQGTRMRSDLPKVLHPLAGRPLLDHVVERALPLGASAVHVVYGHGGEQVPEALAHRALSWVLQAEQLGTGHAVAQALAGIADERIVLVLYGDVPLVRAATLAPMVEAAGAGRLALLTVELHDPDGYGRVLRDAQGRVTRIVEHGDATPAERAVREVNTGVIACRASLLRRWLGEVDNGNAQGEYYLTDVVALAVRDGVPVAAVTAPTVAEILGVNDKLQLAEAEAALRREEAQRLMRDGVTLADPARIDLRGRLRCGREVFIDVNAVFEGEVQLGDGVRIGAGACIRDSTLGAGTVVLPYSVIEGARTGANCTLGPFARLRPGTQLDEGVRIGNFVEVKMSEIRAGSKVNHLSYIGDASIGSDVNVGAGTITCNYDGAAKHRTVIGDGAFIGSGTELVAPVTVGEGAYIGSGSTITRDAPPGELSLARSRQVTIPGWKAPERKD